MRLSNGRISLWYRRQPRSHLPARGHMPGTSCTSIYVQGMEVSSLSSTYRRHIGKMRLESCRRLDALPNSVSLTLYTLAAFTELSSKLSEMCRRHALLMQV